MNVSPSGAQHHQIASQKLGNILQLTPGKAEVLTQFGRPMRTLQIKYHLTLLAHHVHMWWPVVVGVDDNAQSEKS
jgi:hypothetical protein